MFPNLEAEIKRESLTKHEIADFLGISYQTLLNKMGGITEFTRKEMFAIRDRFFSKQFVDVLFSLKSSAA